MINFQFWELWTYKMKYKRNSSNNNSSRHLKQTNNPTATEYAIAFKYSSTSALNRFVHKAALISPPMTISSDRCLVVTMIAITPFKIKLAYLDNVSKYQEVRRFKSLVWSWSGFEHCTDGSCNWDFYSFHRVGITDHNNGNTLNTLANLVNNE